MLNEKKIEEAARKRLYAFRKDNPDGYSSSIIDIESDCLDNFKAGAHWAIQEFLKELWHSASEKPEDGECILVEEELGYDNRKYYHTDECDEYYGETWEVLVARQKIIRWLYLDDLLPKQKGGEE